MSPWKSNLFLKTQPILLSHNCLCVKKTIFCLKTNIRTTVLSEAHTTYAMLDGIKKPKRTYKKKVKIVDPRYHCPDHAQKSNMICYRCGYRVTLKEGVTVSFPYWSTVDRLETLSAEVANRCLPVLDLEPILEQ